MTEYEKELIRSYIAMCRCCLLARAMKDCPACRFNVGLTRQDKHAERIQMTVQPKITVFAMAE